MHQSTLISTAVDVVIIFNNFLEKNWGKPKVTWLVWCRCEFCFLMIVSVWMWELCRSLRIVCSFTVCVRVLSSLWLVKWIFSLIIFWVIFGLLGRFFLFGDHDANRHIQHIVYTTETSYHLQNTAINDLTNSFSERKTWTAAELRIASMLKQIKIHVLL